MMLFKRLLDPNNIPAHRKKVPIQSPLSGKISTLDRVPNEIFKQRLFGEGVVIEPAGYQLFSPFAAKVEHLPTTAHQIRLRAKNGIQLLIQLGIGSEGLMAEGFKAKVKVGDWVSPGQVLMEFDLRIMKQKLDCLLCPITILNSDKLIGVVAHCHQVMAIQDDCMTLYI
jgi:PTS system glucose-specific IIA component